MPRWRMVCRHSLHGPRLSYKRMKLQNTCGKLVSYGLGLMQLGGCACSQCSTLEQPNTMLSMPSYVNLRTSGTQSCQKGTVTSKQRLSMAGAGDTGAGAAGLGYPDISTRTFDEGRGLKMEKKQVFLKVQSSSKLSFQLCTWSLPSQPVLLVLGSAIWCCLESLADKGDIQCVRIQQNTSVNDSDPHAHTS